MRQRNKRDDVLGLGFHGDAGRLVAANAFARPNGPAEPSPGLSAAMPWVLAAGEDGGLKGRESRTVIPSLAPLQGAAVLCGSSSQGIAALSPGLGCGGPLGRR